ERHREQSGRAPAQNGERKRDAGAAGLLTVEEPGGNQEQPDLDGLLDVAVAGDGLPRLRAEGDHGVGEQARMSRQRPAAGALYRGHGLARHQEQEDAESRERYGAALRRGVEPAERVDEDADSRERQQRERP